MGSYLNVLDFTLLHGGVKFLVRSVEAYVVGPIGLGITELFGLSRVNAGLFPHLLHSP